MQFKIAVDPNCKMWEPVGDWFNDFVQLGINLARFSTLKSLKLDRILISVPRKDYVSIAIALGFSIHKLISKEFIGREVEIGDLEKIPVDSMIRIYFTSGGFINAQLKNFDAQKREITFHTGEGIRHNKIDKVIHKIVALPQGYPLGKFTYLNNLNLDSNEMSMKELWQIQISPGILIFTDQENFKMQLLGAVQHESLLRIIDDVPATVDNAIRIANYFNHDKPSFVNAYAGVSEVKKLISIQSELLNLFNWIILDGNNAITRLTSRDEAIDKRVISVMEMGVPRSQNSALESLMSELNRFNSIDIRKVLNWKPPIGVNVWGWAS